MKSSLRKHLANEIADLVRRAGDGDPAAWRELDKDSPAIAATLREDLRIERPSEELNPSPEVATLTPVQAAAVSAAIADDLSVIVRWRSVELAAAARGCWNGFDERDRGGVAARVQRLTAGAPALVKALWSLLGEPEHLEGPLPKEPEQ